MKPIAALCAALILTLVLAGCAGAPATAPEKPAGGGQAPTKPPEPPVSSQPPATGGQTNPPATQPEPPAVERSGTDLIPTGIGQRLTAITWSPSGKRALLSTPESTYLLETGAPSLKRLEGIPGLDVGPSYVFAPDGYPGRPSFWTEDEVAWYSSGPKVTLSLRNLKSGTDRILHTFPRTVTHFARAEEKRFVYGLHTGFANVGTGYHFGPLMVGEFGSDQAREVIPVGRPLARLADGRILATENALNGRLALISTDGTLTWLTSDPAYFPEVSPDGVRVLWFSDKASSMRGWFGKTAHASGGPGPEADTLWVWNGKGAPIRIALGGRYDARALFEPDGVRIAVALNKPDGPGTLAMVGAEVWSKIPPSQESLLKKIYTHDPRFGLMGWADGGPVILKGYREKTGGHPPLHHVTPEGKETVWSGLLDAGPGYLVKNRRQIYWPRSSKPVTAAETMGWNRLPARHTDPYLAVVSEKGIRLVKLER